MQKLNPSRIPKFKNDLEKLPIFIPSLYKREDKINYHYSVDACEFYQQMLPQGFNKTKVWGFAGLCKDSNSKKIKYIKSSPGPTFEVERDISANIEWNNKILGEYMFPIDTTLPWTNPHNIKIDNDKTINNSKEGQWPPTLVMHLHGMISSPKNDGNPKCWYTATGIRGPLYTTNYYKYNNLQPSAMLWYYDQSPGVSRLSVYSGLCGMYLIKDDKFDFPKENYHIPLIIQDKSFYEDGSLCYNDENSSKDEYKWKEKFLGDVIVVNGKVWPKLKVENQLYRFNIVNGSNYRSYKIALSDNSKMIQIGSDAGYIDKTQELEYFILHPGERIDILVDFSKYKLHDKIIMKNLFSENDCQDIMEFEINSIKKKISYNIPNRLISYPNIKINREKITTFLMLEKDSINKKRFLIDGKSYLQSPINIIKVGSSFIWEFINLAKEDICIHLHLIHFQIVERQRINISLYKEKCKVNEINNISDEFLEEIILPEKYEAGFKDTLHCPAYFITRIIVRYAPYYIMEDVDIGENFYSFNTSEGPEYIINSQILEQKDNYMIRPQIVFCED